jgi:hypothetical protein
VRDLGHRSPRRDPVRNVAVAAERGTTVSMGTYGVYSSVPNPDTERIVELTDALTDMVHQFGYFANGALNTGGLSALEGAFEALGWTDPHPVPERCCDEPGCTEDGTCGWPTESGYRRTCYRHWIKEQRTAEL